LSMPGVEAWSVSGISFRLTAYYAAKTRFGQKLAQSEPV